MELRHLRYFVAVAGIGNLSRAAAQLRVAQPALTRQVRDLERELGVALLERHSKGVTPTLAGEAFARGAMRVLADTAAALERAESTSEGVRGRVVVGAMRAVIMHGFAAQLVEALQGEHPEITVSLRELDFRDLLDALESGSADAIIGVEPEEHPVVVAAPLWEEVADHALLPAGHHLAARASVTPADLGELPLVIPRFGSPLAMRKRALDALHECGFKSPILILEAGLHAGHVAVSAGRGWTLVVRSLAAAAPEGTAAVPIEGFAFKVPVAALWRADERRPVVRTVLTTAFELARQIPGHIVPPKPRHLPPGRIVASRRREKQAIPAELAIRHLRALLGVAGTQSIGRAAEQLGISQPALSRQLQELEHATGLALLDRSARGVTLTAAGSTLAQDCPKLLLAIEELVKRVTRARRGMEGRCVIGAVATVVTSELLTSVMSDCLSRYSHIQVAIDDIPTPRQLPALARGEIDLALAHAYLAPAETDAFDRQRLVEDRVRTALIGASHPLANHTTIQPPELADVPFLFMERGFYPALYDDVMSALAALGLTPRIDGTQDSLHAVWSLAAQGKGWCLGFDSQRRRPPTGTVAVPIAGLDLRWGIDLLSRKGESNPAVTIVAKLLVEAGARRGGA
jgi:DNA-binding transcriptional LysR family regulator